MAGLGSRILEPYFGLWVYQAHGLCFVHTWPQRIKVMYGVLPQRRDMVLSEINLAQKDTYCVVPFT